MGDKDAQQVQTTARTVRRRAFTAGLRRWESLPQRTRLWLVALPVCVLAFACWWQYRTLASAENRLAARGTALLQMKQDAEVIHKLESAPKRATEQLRSKEELLATIEQSMMAGGIPVDRWLDTIPQPPVQRPGEPIKRVGTRFYIENVGLEQLASFTVDLVRRDLTLDLTSLHLTAPRGGNRDHWDADLVISYAVVE